MVGGGGSGDLVMDHTAAAAGATAATTSTSLRPFLTVATTCSSGYMYSCTEMPVVQRRAAAAGGSAGSAVFLSFGFSFVWVILK